jgi:putative Ca2+/H+ antiporter (TMEM165/GDT1 family)
MYPDARIIFTTLIMVFIMEMGDKTQLLVIALTSRYRPLKVFLGVLTASFLLNILAVLCGSLIGGIKIIQDSVRIGASLLFIFFGLMSIKCEDEDKEKNNTGSKRVIFTIAISFFLAELGDKTQLASFSFAALYPENPVSVFLGATSGLLLANCLGLFAGTMVIRCLPKRKIAYISSVLFILFGLFNGWTTLKYHFMLDINTCIIATTIASIVSGIIAVIIYHTQKHCSHKYNTDNYLKNTKL